MNGEPRAFAAGASALDAVTALGFAGRPLAVEINERIVPRRDLAQWRLATGDRIEIVTLVGGGCSLERSLPLRTRSPGCN